MKIIIVANVAALLLQFAARAAGTLHVATNGNDAWSGKLAAPNANRADGPLASLTSALLPFVICAARLERGASGRSTWTFKAALTG